jgi:multiple sugar transport system permease protein
MVVRVSGRREDAIRLLLLVAITAGFLLPLAWTALASVGVLPENSSRPPSWRGHATLDHFLEIGVAEPAFWQELATSTFAALVAACLTVAVSFPAAFALARSRFPGSRTLTQAFLVLASLPAMAYVIPLSDLSRRVHLIDTFAGVTLSEAAVTAPLAVFVLHGSLARLTTEWEEAAVIDGAGLARILSHVVLPLAAPSLAATLLVMFVLDWNLLLVPLILTSGEVRTIPVALSDFFTFERELDWPTAAAALMVSLAPLAALVALFHQALEGFTLQAPTGTDIG